MGGEGGQRGVRGGVGEVVRSPMEGLLGYGELREGTAVGGWEGARSGKAEVGTHSHKGLTGPGLA